MEGLGDPWRTDRVLAFVSLVILCFLRSPSLLLALVSLKEKLKDNGLVSNLLPYGYRRGARYDLSLPAPPTLQDRYVCDSAVLRDAKLALPPWFWDACNLALNGVFLDGQIPLSPKDLASDREGAMKAAVSFFCSERRLYAGRPDQKLGASPCMIQLRQTLGKAPTAPKPGRQGWGNPVQGLVFTHTKTLDFYNWDEEYLQGVFAAASDVVEMLGPHAQGWASARWEVYDKVRLATIVYLRMSNEIPPQYSQLPGLGLRYDRDTKEWYDCAAGWLGGKLSSAGMEGHLRSQSAAGIAFNELLSKALSSSSAQRPSEQAGPSTISPVRSPSAARSSS